MSLLSTCKSSIFTGTKGMAVDVAASTACHPGITGARYLFCHLIVALLSHFRGNSRFPLLPKHSGVGLVVALLFLACLSFSNPALSHALTAEQQSVEKSISFLSDRMDEFHNRFPIYDDISSAGNHFTVFGFMGSSSGNNVSANGSWSVTPHAGATCLKFSFTPENSTAWGGIYMMNGILPSGTTVPIANWGTVANAGITELNGRAQKLTFWAKGTTGAEKIKFFFGGVGRNADTCAATVSYPDSACKKATSWITLTTGWVKYEIDLTGVVGGTSYVLGGFGWESNYANNPVASTVFYVDDINIELTEAGLTSRLAQSRFLRSYLTAPNQPDPFDSNKDDDIDLTLRNTAYSYDNALALIAFLAHGTDDSIRRARLIGDAFVYAQAHDRSDNFADGRIRSGYAAGDISLPPGWTPNGKIGTVPIPGFYNEPTTTFYEVEQTAVDTGNNAWVMVALLKLYQKTSDTRYLDAARRIGNFIHGQRNNSGTYQGFLGGFTSPEATTPIQRTYASVEHNLDIVAAFSAMHNLTGEAQWKDDADHAKAFVETMYDSSQGCYLPGTNSPSARNTLYSQLPLDVQVWSILALRSEIAGRYTALFACVENNLRTTQDGFFGFDFNTDKDGVWFEGTGQAAVAYTKTGRSINADQMRNTLRQAQYTVVTGDAKGTQAASHDGVTTGFDFKYNNRKHIGATAWNVFAQLGFNPYYSTSTTLYAYFTGYGLYKWNGFAWSYLHPTKPASMAAGSNLYAYFTGFGLYKYDTAWSYLHPTKPTSMAGGTNLYAYFTGADAALYKYDTAWSYLHPSNPESMAAGTNLYAFFNSAGLWNNDTAWSYLHPSNPEIMAAGTNLYAFFTGSGLWKYDGSAWSYLHNVQPESMTAGTNLYAYFNGYGLYKYDSIAWNYLHPDNPASMAAGDNLYAFFTGYGLWEHDRFAWSYLHPSKPESMAAGEESN